MKIARTKEEMKRLVDIWKRAGPELEKFRYEELRNWVYDWTTVDALLDMGDRFACSRSSNGMVVMQKWFMKFAEQKGFRPRRVREASASYLANTASSGMQKNGETPLLYSLGDRELLDRKWISFFCSVRCPGNLILKTYDLAQRWRAENQPVIGGFHSPVEKEVLNIMLRSTVPVCIVLAPEPAEAHSKRIPPGARRRPTALDVAV